jgi:hypothetical protein
VKLPREIREEHRFREQLEALGIEIEQWDEVFSNGLEPIVVREPELFFQPSNLTCLRLATIEVYRDMPKLDVLFAFDDDRVYLLDVYMAEDNQEEEE